MAASFAPYGWLTWLVAVVLALAATRGRTRIVAAAPGPRPGRSHPRVPALPSDSPPARRRHAGELGVLALNLRFGLADLVRAARCGRRRGSGRRGPHRSHRARRHGVQRRPSGAAGCPTRWARPDATSTPERTLGTPAGRSVLSRYPLTELSRSEDMTFTNLAVRVALPEHPVDARRRASGEPGLWGRTGGSRTARCWRDSRGPRRRPAHCCRRPERDRRAPHAAGPRGESRAHRRVTAGWHPTYPADAWYPPLIQIDHVLVSREFAATAQRHRPGARHRPSRPLVRLAMA